MAGTSKVQRGDATKLLLNLKVGGADPTPSDEATSISTLLLSHHHAAWARIVEHDKGEMSPFAAPIGTTLPYTA